MHKSLTQTIEIPEGIEVEIAKARVSVSGPEGKNEREFDTSKINLEKKDNKIMISNKKSTKKEKRNMNTIAAHIKNMIKGVQEKFEYKLKICFSHFPITVEVKGNEALIKNFLGEKVPRKAKIPEGVDVKIDRDVVIINSLNKEVAGQAAANFENATKISMRDRRIFQDGIFITSKCGKDI